MKNLDAKWFGIYLCFLGAALLLPLGRIGNFFEEHSLLSIKFDKWMHAMLMMPWMSFYLLVKKSLKATVWQWFFMGFIMAVSIEFMQYPLHYRSFNLYDIRANLAGLVLGIAFYQLLRFAFSKEEKTGGR